MSKDMAQVVYELVKPLEEHQGFVLTIADEPHLVLLKSAGWNEHYLESEITNIKEMLQLTRDIEWNRDKLKGLKKESEKIARQITERRKVLTTVNQELKKALL